MIPKSVVRSAARANSRGAEIRIRPSRTWTARPPIRRSHPSEPVGALEHVMLLYCVDSKPVGQAFYQRSRECGASNDGNRDSR